LEGDADLLRSVDSALDEIDHRARDLDIEVYLWVAGRERGERAWQEDCGEFARTSARRSPELDRGSFSGCVQCGNELYRAGRWRHFSRMRWLRACPIGEGDDRNGRRSIGQMSSTRLRRL
jgi:hypothetical protein